MTGQSSLTATFLQCLSELGLTALTVTNHAADDVMEQVSALNRYDGDEQFEIYEQLQQLNTTPMAVETVESDRIETDDFSRAGFNVDPRNVMLCGRARPTVCSQTPIKTVTHQKTAQIENNNQQPFSAIFHKFSENTRSMLAYENITAPIVFARLTNEEIKSFNLNQSDMQVMACLVIQCRAEELKNRPVISGKVQMPDNAITKRLPITSRITLKVLHKSNLLSPNALYLSASIESVLALFEKFPSIPDQDKQNILTGMALARYADKQKSV